MLAGKTHCEGVDSEDLNTSEEKWFNEISETEQDPESLGGPVDTSEDEGSKG